MDLLKQTEPTFSFTADLIASRFQLSTREWALMTSECILFMDFIRMIYYIRPFFFIMENVEGIMSAPFHEQVAKKVCRKIRCFLSESGKLTCLLVYPIVLP